MEYKDYYKIMGVARDASQDDIKRSYRKLARKYHPDVSKEKDAEARFKEVGEAYEVLKDVEKRAAYDQLGMNWKAGQEFRPPPGWDAGFEFRDRGREQEFDFSDFFEALYGRQRGNQGGGQRGQGRGGFAGGGRPAKGEDHHAKVMVDLEDSYHGGTRTITLQTPELTPDGHVSLRERSLNVRIPKGIRAGQQIRLAGQGAPGPGSLPAGDLYLEVQFRPHARYTVVGADVYLDLPVTPWEAALGAQVTVDTPGGPVDLKVPAHSQAGRKLRLKGRGLPGTPAGDLYAVLSIVLPPADTETRKAAWHEFAKQFSFNPRSVKEA